MEKIPSVHLKINIYMWPQEGTITQHYRSQQSSCIKADQPTLIYSLISGHQLMSLFWATERACVLHLLSIFTCIVWIKAQCVFIHLSCMQCRCIAFLSPWSRISLWRGWTSSRSGGGWGMRFRSGEGEAEVWTHSACMNRQDEAFELSKLLWWEGRAKLTTHEQNRINRVKTLRSSVSRTADRERQTVTFLWFEFKWHSFAEASSLLLLRLYSPCPPCFPLIFWIIF